MAAINDILFRPFWFISIELIFYIISMLITFGISFYSYKVYKMSSNTNYKYLAAAFLSMTAGFLAGAVSNFAIIDYGLFEKISNFLFIIKPSYFYTLGLISHTFFILGGYIILSCLASNVRNKRVILSLLLIALLCAILVKQAWSLTFFYFFSFVLLVVYMVPYAYDNYKEKKSKSPYLVFFSFLLLAISNLIFIGMSAYQIFGLYIAGQFISLLAYIILLGNLILVLRK
ncbi:hypothetical protein HYU23_01070 [Candidatus Woesearchaeota archaeon]|nr:hypothetical protein [Candidatus Woesearchaeota archaeon]